MKYSDLVKYKNGGGLEVNERTLSLKSAGLADAQIGSYAITAAADHNAAKLLGAKVLKLGRADAGTGMWVPYIPNRTVYDYLSGAQTWAASGPFSGCYIEVGQKDGKVYVAHISCESRDDPNVAAWGDVLPGRTVLFSAKMSMSGNLPAGTTNAAAVVFASVAGGAVEVTRVDVQTLSAGGMTGPIFDVQKVANQK